MTKTFYLQFQWMPFFIASLALMHYFPYLLFRIVNTDIISLKGNLKGEVDTEAIVKNYFNYKINSISKMRIRICLNIMIKCMYIVVCILGFWLLDSLLNGNYFNYGPNWIKWTKYNNSMSHDITVRNHPKPGMLFVNFVQERMIWSRKFFRYTKTTLLYKSEIAEQKYSFVKITSLEPKLASFASLVFLMEIFLLSQKFTLRKSEYWNKCTKYFSIGINRKSYLFLELKNNVLSILSLFHLFLMIISKIHKIIMICPVLLNFNSQITASYININ